MQPTLETPRLILRPFALTDASDVQRLAGDARVAGPTAGVPHPYPDGAAEAWISAHAEEYEARQAIVFAITERASGTLIGAISLLDLSTRHSTAELGYWVGVPFWSKGYCTEAAQVLIRFGLEIFSITRVVAECLAANSASARVLEKCGLKPEGRLVAHVLRGTTYEDIVLFGTERLRRLDVAHGER